MNIVTRFAPSPTGMLHIGGARTALFNWLFARHHNGRFILRIDDTDRERSTEEATAAILDGLNWLGITWDEGPIYQHQRLARHAEVAQDLLARGLAYRCYATADDLSLMRAEAAAAGRPPRYNGLWRDRNPAEAPEGRPFVVRLKAPQNGDTVIEDRILGPVHFRNAELDDFILLRADGSPTYMLSTVVDDHDFGVTHIIRGNEHLPNAARQAQLIGALGWPLPVYAHIPLIHGEDGSKLSKRHGAVGVGHYRDLGFLPDALCDYLMRLGWAPGPSHMSKQEAAEVFDLSHMSKGPARFDMDGLTAINFHFMKETPPEGLAPLAAPFFAAELGRPLSDTETALLPRILPGLKERAKTLPHLAESGVFYFLSRPLPMEDAARTLLTEAAKNLLRPVATALAAENDWTAPALSACLKQQATTLGVKFPALGQPLRAALTGRSNSPGVAEVMELLGRTESLARLQEALGG
jgi:glutamyl-tRNA synthetase